MSREILFKAKRKNWRELPKEEWWVEGSYHNQIYYYGNPCDDHYIIDRTENGYGEYWKIDPETICQYIGKNDEKGNQICEHDVISINTYSYTEPEEDFYGEVVYAEGWACWCIQQPGEERPIPLCECEGSYLTKISIMGDAIDNPELLGGAE